MAMEKEELLVTVPQLENEVEYLKKINFLQLDDQINQIQENLHQQAIWAEVFWLRRHNHAQREDPEIRFLSDQSFRNLLEIGAGYGRVLQKIAKINQKRLFKAKLVGIEICPHFSLYLGTYQRQYPVLKDVEIIFDDFYKTTQFKAHSFDLILLPMNTFPSFPFNRLNGLFSAVKQVLDHKGIWIFSTYKLPQKSTLLEFIDKRKGYSSELLGELGQDPIAAEYFTMEARETTYGAQTITYMCYNSLTRVYQLKIREIYRTVQEYILPDHLQSLITNNGFSLVFRDDTSHSSVYGVSPTGD